jgi:hypothetical protein
MMNTGRLPTADGHHRTEVEFERLPGLAFARRTAYFARCESCGWVGRDMATRRDAENDADEHASMMAGE